MRRRVLMCAAVLTIVACGSFHAKVASAGPVEAGDFSCHAPDGPDHTIAEQQQQDEEAHGGDPRWRECGTAACRVQILHQRRLKRQGVVHQWPEEKRNEQSAESNASIDEEQAAESRGNSKTANPLRHSRESFEISSATEGSSTFETYSGRISRVVADLAGSNRGFVEMAGVAREGWRVGEGIAVPSDGADAVWDQLKTWFDKHRSTDGFVGSRYQKKSHRTDGGSGAAAATVNRGRGAELSMEKKQRQYDSDNGTGGNDGGTGVRKGGVMVFEDRRKAIVDAVRWAWSGYTAHAWGKDELMPLTRRGKDSFGLGLTIVDSMDTLWLAGEKKSFDRCVEWVDQSLDVEQDKTINVFETTIRVLGGLLAAYHLSGEDVLLRKAERLGQQLANAFCSPSGIPFSDVNLSSGRAFNPTMSPGSSLSEATTLQLEFSYLSYLTGNAYFHETAQRASDAVETARLELGWEGSKKAGLAPVFVDPGLGLFGESGGSVGVGSTRVTLGARGDSYYEYLLKQWLLSGKRDTKYLERYQEAIRGVEASLLERSHPSRLSFIGELDLGVFRPKMDHLVCFLPGTLALGYHEGAAGTAGDKHLELARSLIDTCVQMYETTATGLAPEIVHFNQNSRSASGDDDIILKRLDKHNILRPETLESLYYLYWITREECYRDSAWAIFQAFERHCRVDRGGYAGLEDVTDVQSKRINKMETFFVSETLKYLLMIFSDQNPMPFDRYVFNTEAHAFPIIKATETGGITASNAVTRA